MAAAFSWKKFRAFPVIGILRGFSEERVRRIARASLRGGLRNLEVTMNSPGAPDLIRVVAAEVGEFMNVGAGTVCTAEDFERALEAGASFIVTPALVPEVIAASKARGVPVIPGAFTPTEIYTAWRLGADLVKVFPANRLGPGYLRDVKAPLGEVKLVPTGGITVETLAEYRHAGADGFGVGSPLFHRPRIEAEDWAWVENQVRRFREACEAADRGEPTATGTT